MQLCCAKLHATTETPLSIAAADHGAEIPLLSKNKVILLYVEPKENIYFRKRPRSTSTSKIPKILKVCKDMIKIFQYLGSWWKRERKQGFFHVCSKCTKNYCPSAAAQKLLKYTRKNGRNRKTLKQMGINCSITGGL